MLILRLERKMKEVFVGNIAFDVTEADLQDFFAEYGAIDQCKLITDRASGKSKGFGFVKYMEAESAAHAVKETHGQLLKGRPLNVKISEPRESGSGGGARTGGYGRPSGGAGRPSAGRPGSDNRRFGGRSDRD